MSSLSRIALRQAEERTKLVVDCAGLVRRLEELDNEIASYDQWQRYPSRDYRTNVQVRFEEARMREAQIARRELGTDELPLASLRSPGVSPPHSPKPEHGTAPRTVRPQSSTRVRGAAPQSSSPSSEELCTAHLSRALRAAEFEAEVWRHRAEELANENDQEIEQAKRLMEFELSSALKLAEEERAHFKNNLRDRDNAFEKLEQEHRALLSKYQGLQQCEAQCKQFAGLVLARENELADVEKELNKVRDSAEAQKANLLNLDIELHGLRSDRDKQAQVAKTYQVEATRLAEQLAGMEAELSMARKGLTDLHTDHQCLRDNFNRLETDKNEQDEACKTHKSECARLSRQASEKEAELSLTQQELRDAHSVSDTLRANLAKLETERDKLLNAYQIECVRLAESMSTKEIELSTIQKEFVDLTCSSEALRANLDRVENDLGEIRSDRDQKKRALETYQLELPRLQKALAQKEEEITKASADAHALKADVKALRADHDAKEVAVTNAQRKTQLLNAKCENLEAALSNSTSKQAELALERDGLKEQVSRLLANMEEVRALLPSANNRKLDVPVSLASTMTSLNGSAPLTTPPTSPLPPVRPPSASSSRPAQQKKEKDWA